ncbi:MAG: PEP-CTERM sorting domain-containing protein, partial [Alphaproteobacteria bacterium]|nr:PEP-CTERM sorting domain-containing protein [Alphaproteobacteria bacterium]
DMRGGIMVVGTYAAVPGELVDGTVVVGLDGTFSGSGTVLGSLFRVVEGGTLAPGSSPGRLIIEGDLVIEDGGTLQIEIAGLDGALHDLIDVGGNVVIGAGAVLDLRFLDGFAPDAGDLVDFISYGGSVTGGFASVRVSGLADGWDYGIGLTASGEFRLTSLSDAVAGDVPAPATLTLMLAAVGAIGAARQRRRTAA